MAHLIGSENPADCCIEPLWLYRILPTIALVALILAQTLAANHDVLRDALVGTATGLLLAVCVSAFTAKALPSRASKPSTTVHQYPVT
jgi:hypothetical protein